MKATERYIAPSRFIYNAVKDGVLICDTKSVIDFANPTVGALLGADPKKIKETSLSKWCEKMAIDKMVKRGYEIPKGLKATYIKNDGQTLKLQTVVSPLKVDGRLIGFMLIVKNPLVDQNDTEAYFQNRNSVLRAINNLKDRMCYVSDVQTGSNVFVSTAIRRMVGWSADDFIKGGWAFSLSIAHPDDLAAIEEASAHAMRRYVEHPYLSDHETFSYRFRIRHKDTEEWAPLEVNGCLLSRDSDGKPRYILCFVEDLRRTTSVRPKQLPVRLTKREMEVAI